MGAPPLVCAVRACGRDLLEVHGDMRQLHLQSAEWSELSNSGEEGEERLEEASNGAPSSRWLQPLPRRGHTCTLLHAPGPSVLLYGGCLGLTSYLGDLWVWPETGSHWALVEASGESPGARAWHSATAIGATGHLMLVLGGRSAAGCAAVGPWLLEVATSLWSGLRLPITKLMSPRYAHTATLVGATPQKSLGLLMVQTHPHEPTLPNASAPSRTHGTYVPEDLSGTSSCAIGTSSCASPTALTCSIMSICPPSDRRTLTYHRSSVGEVKPTSCSET